MKYSVSIGVHNFSMSFYYFFKSISCWFLALRFLLLGVRVFGTNFINSWSRCLCVSVVCRLVYYFEGSVPYCLGIRLFYFYCTGIMVLEC